jgi:polyhydroxyalkanoate synthesis regulator protein
MTGIKKAIVGTPILVKRYARSRLYDTAGRRYVTIEDLQELRRKGVAFVVEDAETGRDVTRELLR